MCDWRLKLQEEYLSNKTLYKIIFSEFWKIAYRNNNAFFRSIAENAKNFVESTNRGNEFLEGEKIQEECFCDFIEKFNWVEKPADDLTQ